MGQINTREICLLGPTTFTTSGTGPDINLPQAFQAAVLSFTTSTVSGTSPTFDVFIQKKLGQPAATDTSGLAPTGTAIYDDVLHFSQTTTSGTTRISQLATGSQVPTANATLITTADWAQADASIAAGDIRVGPIGGQWRVKVTVSGTSPSAVLAVTAQMIPWST
jgi:hypothetical protein